MRKIVRPSKFLKDLLLFDGADIVGFESDAGAQRVYVANQDQLSAGVVMRHYIRSEEVTLTPALREMLHMEPATAPDEDDDEEDTEGEEWKKP